MAVRLRNGHVFPFCLDALMDDVYPRANLPLRILRRLPERVRNALEAMVNRTVLSLLRAVSYNGVLATRVLPIRHREDRVNAALRPIVRPVCHVVRASERIRVR